MTADIAKYDKKLVKVSSEIFEKNDTIIGFSVPIFHFTIIEPIPVYQEGLLTDWRKRHWVNYNILIFCLTIVSETFLKLLRLW